jgi:Tol biopolymer transport system component
MGPVARRIVVAVTARAQRRGVAARLAAPLVALAALGTASLGSHAAASPIANSATVAGSNGAIAFERYAGAREDDHSAQIFTRSPDGTERQLTRFSGGAFDPAWSPDGTRIAFERWYKRSHAPDQLYTMAADGSDVRKLTTGCTVTNKCLSDDWAAYTPDSSSIAFVRSNRPLVHRTFKLKNPGPKPKGLDLPWPPPPERYDFAASADLMTVGAAGGAPTRLHHFGTDPQPGGGAISWSPDATRMVISLGSLKHPNKHSRLNTALFVLAADGSGLRRITPWALGGEEPDWSPDGTNIVFQSGGGHTQNIYVVHPDGSGLTQLLAGNSVTSGGLGTLTMPTWSPDGTQIAFAAPARHNSEQTDIYTMHADGTQVHPFSNAPKAELAPAWGRGS